MDSQPEIIEVGRPTGSLELPEGLREALIGSRGQEGSTLITDLPSAIVCSILSRIPSPFDVASAFRASRVFWGLAQSAPFRLRLRPNRYHDTGGFGDDPGSPNRTSNDLKKVAAWIRAALTGIRRVMPSTTELDLAGCPILDDDVTGVLGDLHCLECVVLDGCQKLTSSAAHALALSVRSGPRVLSLQRCFRLGPAAAGNLLAAAAAEGSQLQTILLSHLDGLDLPPEPFVLNPVVGNGAHSKEIERMEIVKNVGISDAGGAGLRILALHNCGSLGSRQLAAISEACPYLEVLMLGGSVDGLGLSRPDVSPQNKAIEAVFALVGVTERLSRLRILEVTFFTGSVVRAVRDQVSKSVYVWDFCDKNSVATAAAVMASLKSPSQANGGEEHFLGFPDDLSVGCNIISVSEQDQSEPEVCLSHKRDRDGEGLNSDGERIPSNASSTHQGLDKRWDGNPEDILMAVRAGANCSGTRRRTPLHVAAALGESSVVADLLSIGAAARGMKDSAGASPLFLAAESGHAQVCDHLLRGGADVLASNRTGETPLYIAALRGHSSAVEVMLRHCQDYGINWQDADVYGDGWTPLMAATVADRQEVGKVLLWAAGTTSSITASDQLSCPEPRTFYRNGTQICDKDDVTKADNTSLSAKENTISQNAIPQPGPAPQLLNARNRYGQTALHIAARRGFLWFVSNLLLAGASPHVQDEYGLRAIDVARKQNHSIVEKLLKEWGDERQSGSGQSPGSNTSKKQTGRKKERAAAAASKLSSRENLKNQSSASKISSRERLNDPSSSSPSTRRVLSWVAKTSLPKSVSGETTAEAGAQAEGSNSTPELVIELLSSPDSPTTIVPIWMHSSRPSSPHVEQLPAASSEQRSEDEDAILRASPEDNTPDLLGSAQSRGQGTQNYWRGGRGTRQRTSSGDSNISISLED